MTGAESSPAETDLDARREAEARRRRRLEVFGDVLPATTGDDRDPDDRLASEASVRSTPGSGDTGNDEWLKVNVPPHHS